MKGQCAIYFGAIQMTDVAGGSAQEVLVTHSDKTFLKRSITTTD